METLQRDNVSIDEILELTKETLRTLNSAQQKAVLETLIQHADITNSLAGETILQTRNPESKEVKENLPQTELNFYKKLLEIIVVTKNVDKRQVLELLNVPETSSDNMAFTLFRATNEIERMGIKYDISLIRWKIYVAKPNTNGTFSYNEMSWGY